MGSTQQTTAVNGQFEPVLTIEEVAKDEAGASLRIDAWKVSASVAVPQSGQVSSVPPQFG
jgi:hypothetical protein